MDFLHLRCHSLTAEFNRRNIYIVHLLYHYVHTHMWLWASNTSQLRSLYFTESLWRPLNVKRAVKCPRGDTWLPVSARLSHCLQCNELGQTVSTYIDYKPLLRAVDSRAINITLEGVMAVIKGWLDLCNFKIKNRRLVNNDQTPVLFEAMYRIPNEIPSMEIHFKKVFFKSHSCYCLSK